MASLLDRSAATSGSLLARKNAVLLRSAHRIANLAVASLFALVSVGNAVGELWQTYYCLAAGFEVAVLDLIVVLAWWWPKPVPGGPSRRVVPLADRP